jgi:pyridoxine kinase
VPHGTGDLLAALYLHFRLSGEGLADALSSAVSRVHDVISLSIGLDELALVESQDLLRSPRTLIAVSPLARP